MINYKETIDSMGFKFFLFIPLLNALADIFTNFYDKGEINPGNIRAVLLIFFIIGFLLSKPFLNRTNNLIIVYLFFVFFLVMLSSNFLVSFTSYIKFFIPFMLFPIAKYYITDYEKLNRLLKYIVIGTVIILINIIVSNIFKIGSSDYLEDSFYFGTGRVNITKVVSVILILAPFIIMNTVSKILKKYISIIFATSFIVVLIGLKRSSLLTTGIGLLIYLLFSPYKYRIQKQIVFAALILLISWPLLSETILSRFEAREGVMTASSLEEFEDQARAIEFLMVKDALLTEGLKHTLFGSEIFNDREFFNVRRMLHMDYSILLNGSGIIGFSLYLLIMILIYNEKNKYFNSKNIKSKEINALFNAVFITLFIMSLAGSIYAIGLRSLIFILLGSFIGIMKNNYLDCRNIVKQVNVQ